MSFNISQPTNPGSVFYPVGACNFGGSPQKLQNTNSITASDGCTISLWVKFNSSSTNQQQFFSYANVAVTNLFIAGKLNGLDKLFFEIDTAAGSYVLRTNGNYNNLNGWIHFLVSVNTNFSSGSRLGSIYVNDIRDTIFFLSSGGPFQALVNNSGQAFQIGSNDAYSSKYLDGSVSELYIANGYTDLSIISNRRRFITASKRPAFLGTNGSLPTGSPPLIYLKGSGTGFNVNSGTLGNFTTSGTLTTPTTTPSSP